MKRLLAASTIVIVGASMLQVGNAEARRFGGGASFGYHRMLSHTSAGDYGSRHMLGTSHAIPRHGIMGAIAGMAVGGLIGTLLFGGAFHGIDMFDVLVIGGILLAIFVLIRGKTESMAYVSHQFTNTSASGSYGSTLSHLPMADNTGSPVIDQQWFLDSAKQVFVNMQAAWDAKDMTDIRRFCTPEIASHIELDMMSRGEGRALTEVTTLNADIAEAWLESGYEWAAVSFQAMVSEQSLDGTGALTEDTQHQISEIWIFRHDPRTGDPTWFLAGIQQAG